MLLQFNFKNFKSFKDENTLDMQATNIKEHEYNTIDIENEKYLKVASIYGANASGKTNILEAFEYMRERILKSVDDTVEVDEMQDKIFKYDKFMFDNESKDAPIEFEVYLLSNEKKYQYGFSINYNKIESEWLYIKGKKGYKIVFERNKDKIKIGKEYKSLEKYKETKIASKALFLTLVRKLEDNIDLANVYNWFVNSIYLNLGYEGLERFLRTTISRELVENDKTRNQYNEFIKSIDVGIKELHARIDTEESSKFPKVYLNSIHENDNGIKELMPFDMESDGTKKMFSLYKFFIDAFEKGKVLFIDELDAKLHPLLTRYIIGMFHNKEINKANGQLIYSTHDTVNLNKETFRRDEIWFVEKDEIGVSNLYSLSDYKIEEAKVRNDATYNKDYLGGRYGAIPVLKDFGVMNEGE